MHHTNQGKETVQNFHMPQVFYQLNQYGTASHWQKRTGFFLLLFLIKYFIHSQVNKGTLTLTHYKKRITLSRVQSTKYKQKTEPLEPGWLLLLGNTGNPRNRGISTWIELVFTSYKRNTSHRVWICLLFKRANEYIYHATQGLNNSNATKIIILFYH